MRRRKFTVGFDCVRTTNDAEEYPHFVYKYSPTMQHMSNQSDSSIEPCKLLRLYQFKHILLVKKIIGS